ncbi:MAG TPA: BatA domain-containing protein [Phycisphaerae bacterium]|nr:BatA domain-containing protein [Phycisphaerae bacterium]
MTLLSPLALLVGLTALVPLILHLYQRRRRTVVEFSTNRFFTAAIIRSQRRLRLRRLLLLLLRVATCVFLAFALARPIMSLAGFGGREGTRDVVLLLDDSLSMQARYARTGDTGDGRRTRFELARQAALEVLAELTAGDRAAVITFTGREFGNVTRSGLELSEDLLQLAGQVEQLQPTFAAGDAHTALGRAAKLFQDPAPRNRLLLVLSDLQAGDWRQMDWPQPVHPISVGLVPMTPAGSRCHTWDNVVADQVELSQGTAVVGQPSLLRVRLVNYRAETTPAELILDVDGTERLRRPIELPGESPHVERIPLEFERPGTRRLKLEVHCRDGLAADNTLYATVRVNPQLPVLLVDGEREAGRGRSAAFFLRAALRAVSAEGDAIQVETIRPEELSATTLNGQRVVILSAVRRLSVAQLEELERFVQAGAGLAIVLGEYTDRVFYNEVMGAATRPLGGLLPAELQTLVEANVAAGPRTGRGPDDGYPPESYQEVLEPLHILNADLDHPVLQRFKGTLRSALAGVSVYRVYATRPRAGWVLAALDRDLPLLVERSYGRGRVLLCTTAAHPRWTNVPLRRLFVPLCSRTVSYLAGGGSGWDGHGERVVGEDLELLRGGWDVSRPVYFERPDGTRDRATVKVVEADPVAYVPAEKVKRPGFYRLESSPDEPRASARAATATGEMRGTAQSLAVNVPRRESSPDVLDLAVAEKLAGNWRLHVIDDVAAGPRENVAAGPRTGRGPGEERPSRQQGSLLSAGWLSRGVWDTLLWTVFVFVLAEPIIANQIIRFRRAARQMQKRRAA